ncbi:hypothetical protein [Streptomyces sp. NPDC005955]|uniref:hypothetical protein n=1 Tax=Streptomyces sp. NPDC005955 TaxID=3364738 RepID=UPI0036A8231A
MTRCPAAHPGDPTPCRGPVAVAVLDSRNTRIEGCEHHAARTLATLNQARVYDLLHTPGTASGAAVRVFNAADGLRPHCWDTTSPRPWADQRSRAELRAAGGG